MDADLIYFAVVLVWISVGAGLCFAARHSDPDRSVHAPLVIHLMFWPLSLVIGLASMLDEHGVWGFGWWRFFEKPKVMFVTMTVFIVPLIACAIWFAPIHWQ